MGFLDFFTPKSNCTGGGDIGYYGLTNWWTTSFSSQERNYILSKYQPMGLGPSRGKDNSLVSGKISYSSAGVVAFLSGLASWFSKTEERPIAHKILAKAESKIDDSTPVLDLHFLYNHQISIYYKDRADPIFFDKAVRACEKQIELSKPAMAAFKNDMGDFLPSHRGFNQLAIIYEKQKRYKETIQLCERAQTDEWRGDWQKRIDRCLTKLKQ